MKGEKYIKKWNEFHTIVFDFDGVFTDNKVYLNEQGEESIRCDRSDGLGINLLNRFKIKNSWDLEYFILSKEKNIVVNKRAEKLQIESLKE